MARASEIIGRVGSLFKKDSLQREEVDINELIQEMIALLRSEASKHSILIDSDFSVELPPMMADRVQLQQVLMNLMLNGIEAMKSMNTPGKLKIKSQQDDSGQLMISVTDTGVGLPARAGWTKSSMYFSRLNRKAPVWDCRLAGRLSNRTGAACGPPRQRARCNVSVHLTHRGRRTLGYLVCG